MAPTAAIPHAWIETLDHVIEHAAHLLPVQGPIRTFIHHNTLHAFEHLKFDEAVVAAAKVFGTEPYETEAAFAHHIAKGRIRRRDIEAALDERSLTDATPVFENGPSLREVQVLRLLHPVEVPTGAALDWQLEEGDALTRPFAGASHPYTPAELQALWQVLRLAAHSGKMDEAAPAIEEQDNPAPLVADNQEAEEALAIATLVNPLLIRLCAAFLDQGISYWPMPNREKGLLTAFQTLYGNPSGPPDPWLEHLPLELQNQVTQGLDAHHIVIARLREMGAAPESWGHVVEQTLLRLRGWAGMVRQLEIKPQLAPVYAPPARLVEFLAIAMTLERHARQYVRQHPRHRAAVTTFSTGEASAACYAAFVIAQAAGLMAHEVEAPESAAHWVAAVNQMDSYMRRGLLHKAYEHHHRVTVLDALYLHVQANDSEPPRARIQTIWCLDEREESMRRHLEEVFPEVETYGCAGFFGIAMAYQGLEDPHASPLCPVVVTPRHYVREVAIDAENDAAAFARHRRLGKLNQAMGVGSRTVVRGGLLAPFYGLAAAWPLIGHILLPRLTAKTMHAVKAGAVRRPQTRLQLERTEDAPLVHGLFPGYTIVEMSEVVSNLLRAIGLTSGFAPLIAVLGHGSNSMNNPHESAHDCGATGGSRGGPNGRAFAAMANHPGVRLLLSTRGIEIPSTTWFLGGYHNTADDSVTFYDTDLVPPLLVPKVTLLNEKLDVARARDAHERVRRFESAPTTLSEAQALKHAELHSVNLGQPRPEYGHATNAVAIVGRRSRTRGLFLDRRAFLISYDPNQDEDGAILGNILGAVGPVGAGINLEYYFSFVDPVGYGSGTKLPHNVTGLLGVMDGHSSDLRTGLPWQMVEIHEPVRLLLVIEADPEKIVATLDGRPALAQLVLNRWVQVVSFSPKTDQLAVYNGETFVPYTPEKDVLPEVPSSKSYYAHKRDHLTPVRVVPTAIRKDQAS